MPIRVDIDLLNPNFRECWIVVPCHRSEPEQGYASVKIREISKKDWDLLWSDLRQKEKAWFAAQKENASPLTIADLGEAAREKQREILRRCVIDHDPNDFAIEFLPLETGDPGYSALLAKLISSGFPASLATKIISNGGGALPFDKEKFVELYERLTPDREFIVNLTAIIARFHAGEVLHAVDFWRKSGVKDEKIPPHLLKKTALRIVSQ